MFSFIFERLFSTFLLINQDITGLGYRFSNDDILAKCGNKAYRNFIEMFGAFIDRLDQLSLRHDNLGILSLEILRELMTLKTDENSCSPIPNGTSQIVRKPLPYVGQNPFRYVKEVIRPLQGLSHCKGEGLTEILRKGARLILKGDFDALRLKTAGCSEQTPEEDVYDPAAIQAEIASFSSLPKISVIVPVYNVAARWLDKCVESVLNQSYQNWELCMHDDGSTNPDTLDCLRKWTSSDPRILVSFGEGNLGISAASNAALKMATGEYVALLDHDDELHVHALFEVVKVLNKHPDTDMIFTDEDKIVEDKQGATKHFEPFFKPGWNPQLMLSYMYVGHLTVYRKSIVDSLGAFRSEFDWSQDYDLALRVTEITNRIQHIPKVLYHWRAVGGSAAAGDKPYARASNMAALTRRYEKAGLRR